MTRAKPNSRVSNPGVAYQPIERAVLSAEDAAAYLGLANRKAVQRIVDRGELAPLTYGRSHVFHRTELDRFLADQLQLERSRRGLPDP